jgi:putative radical SAM enzyme (TIGR03279 family)
MSEIFVKNRNALTVSAVEAGSPAARAGIQAGDLLKRINRKPVIDILDYRFLAAGSRLACEIERDGQEFSVVIRKADDDDAGLEFENDLGDKVHTCKNKCVFCFIHQQPKKMRKSLYLMDDDFRLSFMHGNYITLTNLTPEEWARIKEQRLSPLYVSVHATDPELRGKLLGRKEPTPILPQLRELADARIDVHAQIVLCPGLNDGDALTQTLDELSREHPMHTGKRCGVLSVAIVPVGRTQFRERLPALGGVESDYAAQMIHAINRQEKMFEGRLGTRFAWLADEWYHIAQVPYPHKSHYEDFPQLEDGIGTVRLFLENAKQVSRRLPASVPVPLRATLVTAEMPSAIIQQFADRLNQIENVNVNVCIVPNRFFGGDIHIAGLMTWQDISHTLSEFPDRAETIYLPSICLRDGELFLDDVTLEDACAQTGWDIRVVENTPQALCEGMGLTRSTRPSVTTSGHWLIEAE